ncbi:MAG TPA: hypothetical protein VI230_08880, partial [Ignavibacteriaceae bacterium]
SILRKSFIILFVSELTRQEKFNALKQKEFTENGYVKELVAFIEASANGKNGRALESARNKPH